jgi:hypothetical protein
MFSPIVNRGGAGQYEDDWFLYAQRIKDLELERQNSLFKILRLFCHVRYHRVLQVQQLTEASCLHLMDLVSSHTSGSRTQYECRLISLAVISNRGSMSRPDPRPHTFYSERPFRRPSDSSASRSLPRNRLKSGSRPVDLPVPAWQVTSAYHHAAGMPEPWLLCWLHRLLAQIDWPCR